MTQLQLLELINVYSLVIAAFGLSIAFMAFIDARLDIGVRKDNNVYGRTLLVSTKNYRIAWVLGTILGFQTMYFASAVISPSIFNQFFPEWEIYFGWARLLIVNTLLTYLVFCNYRDYRKALDYIRTDESQTVTTVTTISAADIIPVSPKAVAEPVVPTNHNEGG